ncbi:MAG: phosphoribosyltransferase [Acidimicrobiia bacterium]
MNPPVPHLVLSREGIAHHVGRIAREIEAAHPNGVVLVGVLKGSLVFLADLARALEHIAVEVDFLAISRFAPDSGRVRILKDLDTDVVGRDVIVVEDIVDTGLTLGYLLRQLEDRGARSVEVCTLLDRASRRIVPQAVDYRGIECDEGFVLGYGLHVRDLYRNLPFIVAVDRDTVHSNPAAFVDVLYGSGAS